MESDRSRHREQLDVAQHLRVEFLDESRPRRLFHDVHVLTVPVELARTENIINLSETFRSESQATRRLCSATYSSRWS